MDKISKQVVRTWLRARRESRTPPPDRPELIRELRHLTRLALAPRIGASNRRKENQDA